MAKSNLTTCSGIGKTLKTSSSKGLRSSAGRMLATKCSSKGTLFQKSKSSNMATKKTKKQSTPKVGVKANGTLKKGYRYAKGGRVVKAKIK